jgi:hypothetical protein
MVEEHLDRPGVKMSMKLSAEMFIEIISSLRSDGTCSHGHEKRKECRVGLRCQLEVVPAANRKANAISVHVHDLSLSGIGMVTSVPFAEESEFVASFSRDGRPAVLIVYRVKYCRQLSSDLFSLGAMFVRVLPDAQGDVLLLGRKPKAKKQAAPATSDTAPAQEEKSALPV